MGTASKPLGSLLSHMDNNELILPEIQRDFVWNRQNVLLLFDSLYRGLPIGFMLVWKARTMVPDKGKHWKVGKILNNFYGYLLDGQQRLAAIQRVRDDHEDYPLMFSMRPIGDEKDSGRFQYLSGKNRHNPWFISVSEVLTDGFSMSGVVDQLKTRTTTPGDRDYDGVYASLSKLKDILKYDVGVIEYEEDDYRKATELFIRFNSTGKKLTRSDLTSAELALQVQKLVSEQIRPTSTKYGSFLFTMPFLIQCLAAVHAGKMQFQRPSEIWDGSDERVIRASWKLTEKGIDRLIEFLSGTVKWDSGQWIPSINALIPLIYIMSKKKMSSEERKLARKWLLLTAAHGYFSGSVHSTLDSILRKLSKHGKANMRQLWKITKKQLPPIASDFFKAKRKSGAAMSLYMSLLRSEKAEDWGSNHTELSGRVIGHNAELQVHHYFPQALLKRQGYGTDEINTFGNYVILSKGTNLDISDKEPFNYINEYKIRGRDLNDQCIPKDKHLRTVKKYKQYLSRRRELLAERMNKYLA